MPSRVSSPLVEVFLLVEQPRQRLSHWSQALAPLDDAAAPPLASVDAYYDPASNQALFGLRYDEQALGAWWSPAGRATASTSPSSAGWSRRWWSWCAACGVRRRGPARRRSSGGAAR